MRVLRANARRCDVNISLRPVGREAFGTKVEIKNMNSFSAMQKAVEFEIARQSALLRAGEGDAIVQETRFFDEAQQVSASAPAACAHCNRLREPSRDVRRLQVTRSMRKKEGLADYRYFPEPDLPALVLSDAQIDAIRATMAETPAAARARLLALGLPVDQVLALVEDRAAVDYLDAVVAAGGDPQQAANWLLGDVMKWSNANGVRKKPGAR